jgi:predicted MFS family arabinose efflux permease
MSTSTISGFAAVVALIGVFVAIEARSAQPLVDIGIFRHRQLSAANLVALCVFAAMTAMFFVASMMMQRVLGFSPLKTGAVYVPLSLCFLAGAQAASRLLQRYSPRQILMIALPAGAMGFAMLARVPADGSYLADLLGPTLLIGLALGATMVPIQVAAFAGIDASDSGLAAGLVNTSQEIGGALGVAILTTLATSRTQHSIARGRNELDALSTGYQYALLGGAALLGVALAITVALLDHPARQHVRADDPVPALTRPQPIS